MGRYKQPVRMWLHGMHKFLLLNLLFNTLIDEPTWWWYHTVENLQCFSKKEALLSLLCLKNLALSMSQAFSKVRPWLGANLPTTSEDASEFLSAERLSVPLFLGAALTWAPEFATLRHKGQQSRFLPCGISVVLMGGWKLHCKAEAYSLQAKK